METIEKKELEVSSKINSNISCFTGKTFSWFGVKVVVFLGSLITLGFAYPWLKCFQLRYIANNTYINGRRQYFDGSGVQLFGKYIFWLFLSIITLGIYSLWWRLKMRKWVAKHTHFVGAPNGFCDFDGGLLALTGIGMVANFLTMITLGIASFWMHCWRERYYASHTVIDGQRLKFNGTGARYFGKKIVWFLLALITFGVYTFWLSLKSKQWTALHTEMCQPEALVYDPEHLYNEAGMKAQRILALHETKEWKTSVKFLVISILISVVTLAISLVPTSHSPETEFGGEMAATSTAPLSMDSLLFVVPFSLISFFKAKKINHIPLMVGAIITLFSFVLFFIFQVTGSLLQ